MNILSELFYEVIHFNFMIWLLLFLTAVLWGLPLLFLVLNRVKSPPKITRPLPGSSESANARVTEITPTGSVVNGTPEMAVTLEVMTQMRGTFTVEKRMRVPVPLMSKLVKGAQVPVLVTGTTADEVKIRFNSKVLRGIGNVKSVSTAGLFVLFFWVLFGYIFAFSMKGTDSYNCAVQQAVSDPRVTAELGKDVKPGFFVWLSNSKSGGGVSNSYYRFLLKGDKGIGNLYVSSYSAPAMNTMNLELDHDGKSIELYSGSNPCK